MSPLAAEAQRVHDATGLSDRQIATATGAKPSTARDWLSGRSAPSGVRADRLIELAEMTDRLARVMRADYIPIWLNRPLEALDDKSPSKPSPAANTAELKRNRAPQEAPRTHDFGRF